MGGQDVGMRRNAAAHDLLVGVEPERRVHRPEAAKVQESRDVVVIFLRLRKAGEALRLLVRVPHGGKLTQHPS